MVAGLGQHHSSALRGLQQQTEDSGAGLGGQTPSSGRVSYGLFAAASVGGIIGLLVLAILAVVAYRRLRFSKSLPSSARWHFFISFLENHPSENKVNMLQEWFRSKNFKVWFDPMAEGPLIDDAVEESEVFVLFLFSGALTSDHTCKLLHKAVQGGKPIFLLVDEKFDVGEIEFGSGCPPDVKDRILPKLLACVEPIVFSFKSDSTERHSNGTVRQLELAYYKRKSYVFSRLIEGEPKLTVEVVAPQL